ncbi:MAG: MFS transporter [Rhodospirillaceae bacterium]|nr:MFS transporter [Rhodospirillaceae bacterium]
MNPSDSDPVDALPGRRSAFLLLFGSLVCVGLGQSLLFTVLPPLSRMIGLMEWQVGAIFAFSGLMWFLMSPIWGRKSDIWGRKPVILLGIAAYGTSMALFLMMVKFSMLGWLSLTVGFPLMVLARGIFGIVGSGTFPAAQAYIADRTTRAERTANIALINAAFGVGVILGPGLGALLIGIDILAPLYAVAAIVFLSAIMIALFLPETRVAASDRVQSVKLHILDRRIMPLAFAGVIMSICQAATMQTAAFFMMDLLDLTPESAALKSGIALTVSAAASLVVQIVAIRTFDLAPKALLIWGSSIALSGYVVFLLSGSYLPIVAALVLHGIGIGMLRPGLGAAASLAVGSRAQGAAAGLITATGPVGHVLSPFIIMPLYQINIFSPYILTGVLMTLLLVYILTSPTIRAVLERASQ